MNERQFSLMMPADRNEIIAILNQSIDRTTIESERRYPRHRFWCILNIESSTLSVQLFYRGHRIREDIPARTALDLVNMIFSSIEGRRGDFQQEFVSLNGTLVSLLKVWSFENAPVDLRNILRDASIVGIVKLDLFFHFRQSITSFYSVYLNA